MNTEETFVITISREIGSGGRTVGRKLAERLGVGFSDKELIKELSAKYNLTPYAIEKLKGEKKNWLADFIKFIAPVPKADAFVDTDRRVDPGFRSEISTDDVFKAETEILKGIAAEGSCVIAGRSGFFVLDSLPNKVDIFITASRENRVARVMRKQGFTKEQAESLIDDVDASRENYVKRYTGTSRYDARNYDLVLNMDNLNEEDAVEIILAYIHA